MMVIQQQNAYEKKIKKCINLQQYSVLILHSQHILILFLIQINVKLCLMVYSFEVKYISVDVVNNL